MSGSCSSLRSRRCSTWRTLSIPPCQQATTASVPHGHEKGFPAAAHARRTGRGINRETQCCPPRRHCGFRIFTRQ